MAVMIGPTRTAFFRYRGRNQVADSARAV